MSVDVGPDDGVEEGLVMKCLICLQPTKSQHFKLIQDQVKSFINLSSQSGRHTLNMIPKYLLAEGMEHGFYCNQCYDQLHEINVLHHKLNDLKESLTAMGENLEKELITSYYQNFNSDCLSTEEARTVWTLKKQFYQGM